MAVLLVPATAMADVITDWSYNASVVLTDIKWGDGWEGIAGPVGSSSTLSYDTPGGKESVTGHGAYRWGNSDTINSGVSVEGSSGTISTNGSSIKGISVTHSNKTLTFGYKQLVSGTIFTAVTLTGGGETHTVGSALDFHFLETMNYGVGYDDDIFFMTQAEIMKSLGSFKIDGVDYYVALYTRLGELTGKYLEMARNALGVGDDVMLYGWTTEEGQSLTNAYDLKLTVSLTPPSVPVPGAVWLMGTGIAGLAAMRRRAGRN